MKEKIKSKITNSEIWKITYPIMIGMLAQTLITLVDTAFLGRLGEVELGAASMAGIYYYFFTTLTWGFAIGVQIIVARRFGEKNFGRISIVMQHGLLFSFLFGVLLFVVMSSVTDLLMRSFISSEAVYHVAVEFIDSRRFGIFFASINFLFRSFYIGISRTKSITYTTVLMTVVNVVFDALLVFGSSFTPKLGVSGAAIASVMAECSATIFFIGYTLVQKPVNLNLLNRFKFERELMGRILNISIPTIFQKFISFGSWLAFFLIIEKLGERALAVTMVCRSVFMILGIPVFAFAATANSITSRLIGGGSPERVRPTLLKIWRFSALCLALPAVLVSLFPEECLRVYTDNSSLIVDAIPIIYLAAIIQYAMGAGMIYFDAVSGTGHTSHALVLEFMTLILYLFAAWFFALGIQAGVFWVWVAEAVYGVFCFILCFIYIYKYKWQGKKV